MSFVLHVLFHAETPPERVAMVLLFVAIVAVITRFLRFLLPRPVAPKDGPTNTKDAIDRGSSQNAARELARQTLRHGEPNVPNKSDEDWMK